jgi:enterochelin esterase family protein
VVSSPIHLEYVGHADDVRLATWMPRFDLNGQFSRDGRRWTLELDLPEQARIEYRIEVERDGRWDSILDPLNPRTATNPFGHNSVLTGPAYVEPRWVDRDVSKPGTVAELRVASEILGGRRSVQLYRPHGVADTRSLPLIFVFDGSDYLKHAAIAQCFDALIEDGVVPPFRAALSDPRRRHLEYTASDDHASCMLEEILPYVERRVAVSSLAAMGASLGAVAAWKLMSTRPGAFAGAVLMSGTFARTPHPELDEHMLSSIESFVDAALADPVPSELAIHQSCGRYESLIDWNREVADVLTRDGRRFIYTETWTGHDWGAWRDQLAPGLSLVLGNTAN